MNERNLKTIGMFDVLYEVASGSFGTVYCVKKGNNLYACKMDKKYPDSNKLPSQLPYESQIYKYLSTSTDKACFLKYIDSGRSNNVDYLILELAKHDLSQIPSNWSIKDRWPLILQCFEGIRTLHELGFVHRDVKPGNFLYSDNHVKLIDLGLAKRYRTSSHIKNILKKTQVGTLRYNSIYAMSYVQSSRRDDLISFVYTAINVLGYNLPWQNAKGTKKEKQVHVLNMKKICSAHRVCQNKSLAKVLMSVSNLSFDEDPNYTALLQCLSSGGPR